MITTLLSVPSVALGKIPVQKNTRLHPFAFLSKGNVCHQTISVETSTGMPVLLTHEAMTTSTSPASDQDVYLSSVVKIPRQKGKPDLHLVMKEGGPFKGNCSLRDI